METMDKITVKDSRMYSHIVLFDMHTDFYERALAGVSDKDAHNRLNTKANHIAWIAGSLLQERYELAKTLGVELKPPSNDLFKDHKGIQDGTTYPTLESYKKDWADISPLLRKALKGLDSELLDSTFEMMPGEQMTYFDFITFIMYREANCIGQIALWRRLLGYEAMNYM